MHADCSMVGFRPSITAISALWCSLEEFVPSKSDAHLAHIKGLLNALDHKVIEDSKILIRIINVNWKLIYTIINELG